MKKVISALIIGLAVTFVFSAYSNTESIQTALADNIVRLHVIANSDSEDDQNLKLKVRDRIIEQTGAIFENDETIDAVKSDVCKNIDFIEEIAKDEIAKNGYSYDVNVTFGKSDFPTKEYGSITLPAGTYDALKVQIGKAQGKNWWCVMFPPLCFVDSTKPAMCDDSLKYLKDNLSPEEYELITNSDDKLNVEIKFKIYEMWQNGRIKLKNMLVKNR